MRQKLEAWLESLSEYYERLRVPYLILLALLIIMLGSLACSKASHEKLSTAQPAPSVTMPATVTNETKNPFTDLAAAAQKGKPVYEANCSYCHGVTGASDGPFQPKPPVINSGETTKATDGALYLVVRNGKGKSMPPMKRMTDEEIWQAIAYVRTLEKK
jgi:mono/diheme cytochrome c family protein